MDPKNPKIGQVAFVLNQNGLIPVKIVEVITRERENGKLTEVFVLTPTSKNHENVFNLDAVKEDGEIFYDVEEVRKKMIENAQNAINSMIKSSLDFFNIEKNENKKEMKS